MALSTTKTAVPDVYFQLGYNIIPDLLTHRLFSLPNVHIYGGFKMDWAIRGNNWAVPGYTSPDNLPESYAEINARLVNMWYRISKQANPTKVFKYGHWPAGYYQKSYTFEGTEVDDSMWDHELDRINIGLNRFNTPWHTAGIQAKKLFCERYFRKFTDMLRQLGAPNPTFVDADVEPGPDRRFFNFDYGSPLQVSWDAHHADPRFSSTLIDGNVTLQTYIAGLRKLDGTPYNMTVYPPYYDGNNPDGYHWAASAEMMIRDYCVDSTLGAAVRRYLPGSLVHDWICFSSSPPPISSSANYDFAFLERLKEAPIFFNENKMKLDTNVPCWYGIPQMEQSFLGTVRGYGTFENLQQLYSIPSSLSVSDKLKMIFVNQIDYCLQRIQKASSKPITPWMSWLSSGVNCSTGTTFTWGPSHVPPDGGSCIIGVPEMTKIFNIYAKYNVKYVGLFEPELTVAQADKYYNFFSNLSLTSSSSSTSLPIF